MKLYLLYIYLILLTKFYTSNEEIVFVFEHFRHGARSSVYINKYNKDIYNIKWIGDGELTPVGMRMEYLIGVHIRTKYSNIINENTSSKEILVFSTDLNRTIVSAQSQLLGMFPPYKGEEMNKHEMREAYPPNKIPEEAQKEINELGNISLPLKGRAIPINYFHKENKPYLLTEEKDCPKTKYIKEENYKKKHVQDFIKKFREKYQDQLMEFFNINDTKIFENYYFLLEITDHFISSYIHKRKHLKFFKDRGINLTEYYKECIKFKNISMYEIETTQQVGIMASSPIYKDILHFMDNIIKSIITKEKNKTITKFVMYSGHDYIIVAVQLFLHKAFGIECFYPSFAANQFFELHKQDGVDEDKLNEENFYVQYLFNGNLLLNVSYTEFKRKIIELMWSMDKIVDFCKVEENSFIDYLFYFSLSSAVIIITFFMVKDSFGEKKKTNTSKNKYPIYKNYQMKDN